MLTSDMGNRSRTPPCSSSTDAARPLGIKGIGEIGVVGVSAAIANALSTRAGRRIRSLPITVEQLL
jgi:xanthine dehydrogenase YagR molybdenum-binding subunit